MRIGLVSYRCKNRDIAFNMRQIERAMKQSAGEADLLCIGGRRRPDDQPA